MMLERQNKELKVKLEELENSNRAKAKAAIGNYSFTFNLVLDLFFTILDDKLRAPNSELSNYILVHFQ